MPAPKVSVLMPTYNYGRFLGEAIESVLAQDFTDYELIIMDDCSADDSRAVAEHGPDVIRAFALRPIPGTLAWWPIGTGA